MPSQQNLELVDSLKTKFQDAKSVIIADYSGLNVAAQTELRAKVGETGAEFKVIKNRLFKLAVTDELKGQEQLEAALNGPNAFLFSYQDAISALKALVEFSKTNEALEIKLGILDDKVLSLEEVNYLSQLPSKPQLIAQLISRINGPAYGLVNVLNASTRSLVYVLKAVHDQKQASQ